MKKVTTIIGLAMLTGAFVSCTIVMPTPEATKEKEPAYTRPTPSTSVVETPSSTRPRPARAESAPIYTRPTPTTTVDTNSSTYKRPTPTTTTTLKSDSVASSSTSKDKRSDGRIDAPKGKHAEAAADTTVQARSRVRR